MLHRRSSLQGRLERAVSTVALLGVTSTYLLSPLNGNIRYEAGVKAVSTYSAAGTFSDRPLAFRILMDGVFRVAHAVSLGTASFEFVVRVLVAGAAAGAGVLLWRGLRAYGVRQAGAQAGVVAGAVLLVGPISTGEPDWMAVVLAAAGVGVGLLGGRRSRSWCWALLAGALFVSAAGMKIITLPTALLGLMVVALLDRRQSARVLVGSVVVGVAYVVVTVVWVPWEVQWLLDMRTVQKDAVTALPEAGPFFSELVARRPALALLPAVLVLAGWKERLLTVLAVAVGAAMIIVQGQYFVYHSTTLVVVAAVAVFRGVRARLSTVVGLAVLTVVVAAVGLTTMNSNWLVDHERLWGGVTLAVGAVAVIWAVVVRTRPVGGRKRPLMAGLVTVALLYPGASPWAAGLLRPANPDGSRPLTTLEQRAQDETTAREVRLVVGGPDVQVTYLTFGEWTYFIGNPTDCRYPSPLFVQRTRNHVEQVGTPSYEENLACLSTPGSRWLVWDPVWFAIDRTPEQVRAIIATEWDCAASVDVGELRLCPRRT